MARSSSGLGHRPLKAEVTGSNPVRATNYHQRPREGSLWYLGVRVGKISIQARFGSLYVIILSMNYAA